MSESLMIDTLVHLADKTRRDGPHMLEEEAQLFEIMWAGLWEVVDGREPEQVVEAMNAKIAEVQARRDVIVRELREWIDNNKRSSDPRVLKLIGREERRIALWRARRNDPTMLMIVEGVLAIQRGDMPDAVQTKLVDYAAKNRPPSPYRA